jgi:hypothetical protein
LKVRTVINMAYVISCYSTEVLSYFSYSTEVQHFILSCIQVYVLDYFRTRRYLRTLYNYVYTYSTLYKEIARRDSLIQRPMCI